MIKKLLTLLFYIGTVVNLSFLFAPPAAGQGGFTTVTGTVTDPNGVKYSCATISAQMITAGGAAPTLNGVGFSTTTAPVGLGCPTNPGSGANGSFAMRLADNGVIVPGNTQWKFTVNTSGNPPPLGTGPQTFSFTTAINCSTNTPSTCTSNQMDISTQLSALAPALGGGGGGSTTFPTLAGGTNTSSNFICGTGCNISTSGTGGNAATTATTASNAIGYQGKVFNATDPAYGLSVSNTAAQNNTALTALATAVNAYVGANNMDYPVVYIPGGNAGGNATYAYSGGLVFTRPFTMLCGKGAMLNYTGSAHAADFGPTGLTSTTLTEQQANASNYTIEDCGFTGAASATQGLFFNQFVFGPHIYDSHFFNFTGGGTAFKIYMSPNISDCDIERNLFDNDDNTARNELRIDATTGFSDQCRVVSNTYTNTFYQVGSATNIATNLGIGFWVDGQGSLVAFNNMNFCAPCIRVGPGPSIGINGTRVIGNYLEGSPNTTATTLIQYGDPASATFVDSLKISDNFALANFSGNTFIGPASATTGLTNTMLANNRLSGFALPLVAENNVAGQTGNTFWDDIGCSAGQCTPSQIVTVSGNVTAWGQPNYPLYVPNGTAAGPSLAFALSSAGGIDQGLYNHVSGGGEYEALTGNPGVNALAFGVESQNASSAYAGFYLNHPNDTGAFPNRGFTIRHAGGSTGTNFADFENGSFGWFTSIGGTLTQKLGLSNTGHVLSTGVLLTGGNLSGCGTSPSILGTDSAGVVTVGTAAGTTCVLTFASAWGAAPACTITDDSAIVAIQGTSTTTTLTFTGSAALTSAKLTYICIGTS
jgi:hypothetical protein